MHLNHLNIHTNQLQTHRH